MPTVNPNMIARAVIKKGQSGSATADAAIAPRSFSADAWVVGGRSGHSRFSDHYGTQPDTVVVLDGDIGPYPTGTTVHSVLADLLARVEALESGWHRSDRFTAAAFIQPYVRADAVIFKVVSGSKTADAYIVKGGVASVTVDAWLVAVRSSSFTAAAYLIDLVC